MWQLAIDCVYCYSLQKCAPSVGSYRMQIKNFSVIQSNVISILLFLKTSKMRGIFLPSSTKWFITFDSMMAVKLQTYLKSWSIQDFKNFCCVFQALSKVISRQSQNRIFSFLVGQLAFFYFPGRHSVKPRTSGTHFICLAL